MIDTALSDTLTSHLFWFRGCDLTLNLNFGSIWESHWPCSYMQVRQRRQSVRRHHCPISNAINVPDSGVMFAAGLFTQGALCTAEKNGAKYHNCIRHASHLQGEKHHTSWVAAVTHIQGQMVFQLTTTENKQTNVSGHNMLFYLCDPPLGLWMQVCWLSLRRNPSRQRHS